MNRFLETTMDEDREENIWQFYNVIRTVEETFKTLKQNLDKRPVYRKSDEGAKANLHHAVLAYRVVSVTRYMLKKKDIIPRCSEQLCIIGTQQSVTIVAEQTNGHILKVRKSTKPEEKLADIRDELVKPPYPP